MNCTGWQASFRRERPHGMTTEACRPSCRGYTSSRSPKSPRTSNNPFKELERSFWLTDQTIVYIGRTHCKDGLNKRLRQFRKHVYGDRSPHRGGQASFHFSFST